MCVLFCFYVYVIFVLHSVIDVAVATSASGSSIRLHKAPLKNPMAAVVVVVAAGAPTLAQIIGAAPSSSSSSGRQKHPNISHFILPRLLYVRRKYKVRVSLHVSVCREHTHTHMVYIDGPTYIYIYSKYIHIV